MQSELQTEKRETDQESSRGYIAGLLIGMAGGLIALTIAISYVA